MSIKSTMDDLLKQAVRDNDVKVKNFVRQLRSKVVEHCLAKGLPRDSDDDATWTQVTLVYRQSIAKALGMLERRGAKDSELAETYRFEVDFCNKFLPSPKTEAEVRELALAKARELGNTSPGKLVGAVMKDAEPGTVDPRVLKKVVAELVG
jgi:uncharacterized protein YqeY